MDTDEAAGSLGPIGPFPRVPLCDPLERRWLHYAFIDRAGPVMIANIASLGGDPEGGMRTSILLLHDPTFGWSCSQWNARAPEQPWSAFRQTPPGARPQDDGRFSMTAMNAAPAVDMRLRRSSTPSISASAGFHGTHWMRWQAEPGVVADGLWTFGPGRRRRVRAVGYHERVRGRWAWPELGGWVFGFCNDLRVHGGSPPWSVVFALMQPDGEIRGQACALMLWRDGCLVRHIPRRELRVTAAGQLDRDRVVTVPAQSALFGTGPTSPIPVALCVDGAQGGDAIQLRFRASNAARLVVPSETSLRPFSVHEVIGEMEIEMTIAGQSHRFSAPGVVEFAGGAAGAADGAFA